jgi:methylenetetrahydrofolate reductase (NADPH)
VAGVHIPDAVIKRLKGAADQAQEGTNVCIDMVNEIREIEGVAGVHIMAYRQEHRVPEIVEKTGVLGDRLPWHPGIYQGEPDSLERTGEANQTIEAAPGCDARNSVEIKS